MSERVSESKVLAGRAVIFTVVLLLVGTYIAAKLSSWAPPSLGLWIFATLLIITFSYVGSFFSFGTSKASQKNMVWLAWSIQVAFGFFILVLLYTLIADLSRFVLLMAKPELASDSFDEIFFWSVWGASAVSSLGGLFTVLRGAKVFEITIPIENLPASFEGFKIAQISDLHVGPLIQGKEVQRVVDTTNKLGADMVVLTGDIIDGPFESLQNEINPLSQLVPKEQVYLALGNHEYYWNPLRWVEKYRQLGINVLLNQSVCIKRGSDSIYLGGVTDYMASRMVKGHVCSPTKAFEGTPADKVRILLAHQPNTCKLAVDDKISLLLAGHTHGGQFFPGTFVVKLFQKYFRGLYRFNKMWIYVNRGTGYWGPPLRFMVSREITLLTLKKA